MEELMANEQRVEIRDTFYMPHLVGKKGRIIAEDGHRFPGKFLVKIDGMIIPVALHPSEVTFIKDAQ